MPQGLLGGLALAMGILVALAAFLWPQTLVVFPYKYDVSSEGVRVMLFGRLLWHQIPAHRIAGARLQSTPWGYWGPGLDKHLPLVMGLERRPYAAEGVVIRCTNGIEVILTPDSPSGFIQEMVASGLIVNDAVSKGDREPQNAPRDIV